MRLGVGLHTEFDSPEAIARAYVEAGYSAAVCPPVSLEQPDRIRAIREAFTRYDVMLAEVGVWNNMLHPDPAQRAANVEANIRSLALADELGVVCCVNIAGSFSATMWDGPHPRNFSQEAFELTVRRFVSYPEGDTLIMDVIVFSSSPNKDGLTAACAAAAVAGVHQAGGTVEEVRLNDLNVGLCEACDNGWGTCLSDHECQVEDDFQALHAQARRKDAIIIVSPVYRGEMSESAKAFTDRLRRCKAMLRDASCLTGKPVIAVVAAGGMITCLLSMERWIDHVRARKFDLIPVNRWTREYKLVTIREAARAMVLEAAGWQV